MCFSFHFQFDGLNAELSKLREDMNRELRLRDDKLQSASENVRRLQQDLESSNRDHQRVIQDKDRALSEASKKVDAMRKEMDDSRRLLEDRLAAQVEANRKLRSERDALELEVNAKDLSRNIEKSRLENKVSPSRIWITPVIVIFISFRFDFQVASVHQFVSRKALLDHPHNSPTASPVNLPSITVTTQPNDGRSSVGFGYNGYSRPVVASPGGSFMSSSVVTDVSREKEITVQSNSSIFWMRHGAPVNWICVFPFLQRPRAKILDPSDELTQTLRSEFAGDPLEKAQALNVSDRFSLKKPFN